MSLDLLLEKYKETYSNLTKISSLHRDTEKQLEKIQKSIADKVSEDLQRFLLNFNSNMPVSSRVTKFSTHYDGSLKRAFITITELNGKIYEYDGSLPSFLEGLRKVGEGHPIEFYFRTLDHPIGDPIDEWK